ncbi:CPBP family intramembrane glutamic endopeptidase [Carboxydothermus pertinax]|uniref:CAAX protease family protein n=1 Tax=Carboxydothermus pertinax TaxID=870242 RepID=A0A1L8CVW1_9THEO|nr:CPBP family intramembrane glutamic endopeptidase [Carboxydothermus pertinax]GAV23056.1 CAAX protease family protein [Carboxydothermus pertinax]
MEEDGQQKSKPFPLWVVYVSQATFGVWGLALLLWGHFHYGIPWSVLLKVGKLWQVFGLGTIVAILFLMFAMAMATFLPERLWADRDNIYFSQLSYVNIFFLMALVAVSEEIFFRAALQTLMIHWLSSVPLGIGIAAAVFAVFHFRYLKKPVLLAGTFAIGLALGLCFWFTGSIWTAVWSHFLHDFSMSLLGKKGMFLPKKKI